MALKVDLDPSLHRVLMIGLLLFFEILLGNLVVLLQDGKMPTEIQTVTILCVAGLQVVTYFLTFLRKEEEE